MAFNNNIYIDRLLIDINGGHGYNNKVYLPKKLKKGINKKFGIQWAIQITNGSNEIINMGLSQVVIQVFYFNNKNKIKTLNRLVKFDNFNLRSKGSIVIGNLSILDYSLNKYVKSPSKLLCIADQIDKDGNLLVTTLFRLQTTDKTLIDVIGISDTTDESNNSFKSSVALSCATGRELIRSDNTWNYNINSKLIKFIERMFIVYTSNIIYNAVEWEYSEYTGAINYSEYVIMKIMGSCHINAYKNGHYSLSYEGALRFYDNGVSIGKGKGKDSDSDSDSDSNNDKIRIVINGEITLCELKRWKSWPYVTSVYVYWNDGTITKNMTINTGFRGVNVSVIENNGFEYENITLPFSKLALRYSCDSRFKSSNDLAIENYLRKNPTHKVPIFRRNLVKVKITNEHILVVENVNRLNLQPCKIKLAVKSDKLSNSSKGIMITKKNFVSSQLETLTDVSNVSSSKTISDTTVSSNEPMELNKTWE